MNHCVHVLFPALLLACPPAVRIHSSANKLVTVCFFLLLLGFYLVARRKSRIPITPVGNLSLRDNATALREGRLPNNSKPLALTKEMSRISNGVIQPGQPGQGSTASGQRGHVEAVADTPASTHDRNGACNVEIGDGSNDGGRVSPGAELSRGAVDVNDRDCDTVGMGRQSVQ